jgi:hypothetical protein
VRCRRGTPVTGNPKRCIVLRLRYAGYSAEMIAAGIALLIVGVALNVAPIWTIGVLLLGTGSYLAYLGGKGHGVGGRRHYF